MEDTTIGWRFINTCLKAKYDVDSMPETGENVAEDFAPRRDQDLFALRSQQRAEEASETEELNGKLWPCPFRKRREIRYISRR